MQENRMKRLKLAITAQAVLCMIALAGIFCVRQEEGEQTVPYGEMDKMQGLVAVEGQAETGSEVIRWVDFDVTYEALCLAYDWDVNTVQEEVHIEWIELLAYLGAKYGGDFDANEKRLQKDAAGLVRALTEEKKTMEELTDGLKYYAYYEEAYRAVLGGLVGSYEIETVSGEGEQTVWQQLYGLKAYSPIARGFDYEHYDDFGSSRSYGYKRPHLGHDMMGQVGTPIRTKN